MSRIDNKHLIAERSELRRFLAEIPQQNVIDRASFTSRLNQVEKQLKETSEYEPAKARLRFKGRPVVGSYGIFAEFGLSASKAFADAVTLLAASFLKPLSPSGPVPNRELYQLLITGPALGSFGFEFEEYGDAEPVFGDKTIVGIALDATQDLLRGSVGTDDELAEAASGTDPRALQAIRAFLETMYLNQATCAVEFKNRTFQFRDVGEVRKSWERLGQENLHEELLTVEGVFEGVLPRLRTFEFRVKDTGELVTGKIGPGVDDPHILNKHLHDLARITIQATKVGSGRPRYVLYSLPEWSEPPSF